MTSAYTLTVYLVGGDRTGIQDLTVRLFDEGDEWAEVRKVLVSSFTEKVRFRVPRGAYDVHVSYVRSGEFWQTPFWGFSVPQVPEIRIDLKTGWVILPDHQNQRDIYPHERKSMNK